MDRNDWLAREFENHRPRLTQVALRMLGSHGEADDAVQETWLRLARSDAGAVDNLGGWLTTVTARICLDALRARSARSEEAVDDEAIDAIADGDASPERLTLLGDAVGNALLIVLDTLPPAERVAFVLHDLFDLPFDEIAAILGRNGAAARQLASRARRRVQGAASPAPDRTRQRAIVDAFLAAARGGDFEGLLNLLDPEIVLRADGVAVQFASATEIHGATAVAKTFSGRAAAARRVTIDGVPGLAWMPGDTPRVVFRFTFEGARIVAIELVGDGARIAGMQLAVVDV